MPNSLVPVDVPFTFTTSGVSRAVLRRLESIGEVSRPLRGVYVHRSLELTPAVRHHVVRLAVPPGRVATSDLVAWAHGLLESPPAVTSGRGDPVSLLDAAVAAGRRHGLPVYDAAMRQGLSHLQLLAAVPADQRALAAVADGRALDAAESRLREAWLLADLPTPFVGFEFALDGQQCRVSLAHPSRAFAATTQDWPADTDARASRRGWWVTRLDPARVKVGEPELLARHLRREFHRQLLAQVSA